MSYDREQFQFSMYKQSYETSDMIAFFIDCVTFQISMRINHDILIILINQRQRSF